jgi:hypothetical protein
VPPEPPLCPGFRAPPCAERGALACAAQDISACCTLAAHRYSSQKHHIQTKLARTAPALCRACRFLLLLADASSLASAWLQSDSSQSSSTSSPAPYLPVQHNCISDVDCMITLLSLTIRCMRYQEEGAPRRAPQRPRTPRLSPAPARSPASRFETQCQLLFLLRTLCMGVHTINIARPGFPVYSSARYEILSSAWPL